MAKEASLANKIIEFHGFSKEDVEAAFKKNCVIERRRLMQSLTELTSCPKFARLHGSNNVDGLARLHQNLPSCGPEGGLGLDLGWLDGDGRKLTQCSDFASLDELGQRLEGARLELGSCLNGAEMMLGCSPASSDCSMELRQLGSYHHALRTVANRRRATVPPPPSNLGLDDKINPLSSRCDSPSSDQQVNWRRREDD